MNLMKTDQFESKIYLKKVNLHRRILFCVVWIHLICMSATDIRNWVYMKQCYSLLCIELSLPLKCSLLIRNLTFLPWNWAIYILLFWLFFCIISISRWFKCINKRFFAINDFIKSEVQQWTKFNWIAIVLGITFWALVKRWITASLAYQTCFLSMRLWIVI